MSQNKDKVKTKAKLYRKKVSTHSGYSEWTMAEAEDGNHYRGYSPIMQTTMNEETVDGYLKITDGKLLFYPE